MSLDFSSKHEIIERVGNPDSWQNVFDDAFFDDKRRKWSSASHGDDASEQIDIHTSAQQQQLFAEAKRQNEDLEL